MALRRKRAPITTANGKPSPMTVATTDPIITRGLVAINAPITETPNPAPVVTMPATAATFKPSAAQLKTIETYGAKHTDDGSIEPIIPMVSFGPIPAGMAILKTLPKWVIVGGIRTTHPIVFVRLCDAKTGLKNGFHAVGVNADGTNGNDPANVVVWFTYANRRSCNAGGNEIARRMYPAVTINGE